MNVIEEFNLQEKCPLFFVLVTAILIQYFMIFLNIFRKCLLFTLEKNLYYLFNFQSIDMVVKAF